MSPRSDRFIELALRGFPDGPGRAAAADELAARIAHAPDDTGELENSIASLERTVPPPRLRLPLITGLVMLVVCVVLGFLIPAHYQEFRLLRPLHRQGGNKGYFEGMLAAMGPAGEAVPLRTLYYENQEAWRKQVEALLARDPEDKALYRFYAEWFDYWDPARNLPPDFMAKWKALDPDNAVWGINAANGLAEKALDRAGRGKVTVKDEPSFQAAMSYLKEAAKCGHSYSHFATIQKHQLQGFVSDGTLKSLYIERGLLGLLGPNQQAWTYSLRNAVMIQAERFAAAGDREGLRTLMSDFHKVLVLAARDPTASSHNMPAFPPPLEAACKSMGLGDEVAWMDSTKKITSSLWSTRAAPAEVVRQASQWHSAYVEADGGITEAELKPARLAEYAMADRFTAVAASLIVFLVLGGCSVEMLRRGAGPRGLARGLGPLFEPRDWIWIFAAGLAAPLVWWLIIVRISPLGCRDIGLTYYKNGRFPLMQPWLSQGAGGIVLLLACMLQTVRWRWAKQGAFLALGGGRLWIGWVMVGVAALFIALEGGVRYLPEVQQAKFLLYSSAAGGIPLLWLLWQAVMGMASPRDIALRGLLTIRVMIPVLVTSMVLTLAAVPFLRQSERHWVADDTLSKPAPDGTGLTILERRTYDADRQPLVEALEK
ncbi:hypothetical protein [Luteolibacter sp. Populi]|uniref:hypothetical protein n=1 Tax=Luteolibacter sp. Populi TaxID=3230487 RepID=UPI003464EFB4